MTHLHIDHATLLTFRQTGVLNLSEEGRAYLGLFQFSENEGTLYGRKLDISERWGYDAENVAAEDQCPKCLGSKWMCLTSMDADGNTLTLETDAECPACRAHELSRPLLPPKYRKKVDYRFTVPKPALPVSPTKQQAIIDQIRSGALDGHSVLLSGPSRGGKTHQACGLVQRMVENYLVEGFEKEYRHHHLPIYRINADEWLAEYLAYDTHNWDSESSAEKPTPPEPNIGTVLKLQPLPRFNYRELIDCPEEFPPIILLEELDKFKPSDYKLKKLFTLMNKVFEAGGMIISTSNGTAAEIRSQFPDWFYRRLVESSKDEIIRHRDLWKKSAPATKRKSAPITSDAETKAAPNA
jgi:hypothetical protein